MCRAIPILLCFALIAISPGCNFFRQDANDPGGYFDEHAGQDPATTSPVRPVQYEGEGSSDAPEEEHKPWDYLQPSTAIDGIREVTGNSADELAAREAFRIAEEQFRTGTAQGIENAAGALADSARQYQEAADRWPDSALQENSLFMVAESWFFAEQYAKAAEAYTELVEKYPRTQHMDVVDARRFAIGQYWMQLYDEDPNWVWTPNFTDSRRPRFDTLGHAFRQLDKIRFDDPTGELADDATMAMANRRFQNEQYSQAEDLYDDLRQSYTTSTHQFEAGLLSLQCKMRLYQGPDYADDGLNEAEQIIEDLYRLFPEEAQEEDEYLRRTFAEVRLRKATRQWNLGQYYERRNEFTPARMQYELVIREYADTSLAEDSRERIAALGGASSSTTEDGNWMTRLFDGDEDTTR